LRSESGACFDKKIFQKMVLFRRIWMWYCGLRPGGGGARFENRDENERMEIATSSNFDRNQCLTDGSPSIPILCQLSEVDGNKKDFPGSGYQAEASWSPTTLLPNSSPLNRADKWHHDGQILISNTGIYSDPYVQIEKLSEIYAETKSCKWEIK